jgi:hypothetical protein
MINYAKEHFLFYYFGNNYFISLSSSLPFNKSIRGLLKAYEERRSSSALAVTNNHVL